ncbi:MAG: type II secretion system protein GspM [Mariprofundaceae bacterium]|nr:type II secretion system protein GspM [Mariprofundaceae bacterium]
MVKSFSFPFFHDVWQRHVLSYYQQLAQREQGLVLFASVIVPLMVLIFGMILPLNDELHRKATLLSDLQKQAQEAEQLAHQILQQGVKKPRGSMMTVVDQEARTQKVRPFITSLRPQLGGDKARLWIQMKQAPYTDTVKFYQALASQGIHIVQIKWQKTPKLGIVNVQAVVQ